MCSPVDWHHHPSQVLLTLPHQVCVSSSAKDFPKQLTLWGPAEDISNCCEASQPVMGGQSHASPPLWQWWWEWQCASQSAKLGVSTAQQHAYKVMTGFHKQPGKLKWKNNVLKSSRPSKSRSKREVCINKDLSQETRKFSNKLHNLTL